MTSTTIHGKSPALLEALRTADLVAVTDVTVLIYGESGTGKELLARRIQQYSLRNKAAFVAVNCATIPDSLAESILFGHRKGAFTGAMESHLGLITEASGGTLFLDEVAELPLGLQAKLLRFLELGECRAVGAESTQYPDVRIIAATNRDLASAVKQGSFRRDLYYRLNVVPLELPPLRERHGDISMLLSTITHQLAKQHQLNAPKFSKRAAQDLEHYQWPGNVRELRNFCERMLILFHGRTIHVDNLPQEIRNTREELIENEFQLPQSGLSLEVLEKRFIHQALDYASGNKSRAARLLGLTRDTLLYRLKKYGM
jgi:DNA-binding NtrC family response regulator